MLPLQWFATLSPIDSVRPRPNTRTNTRLRLSIGPPPDSLIEPLGTALCALGVYDYKFKCFGRRCTEVAREVFPDASGTGHSHRCTIQRPSIAFGGPSVVAGSAASAAVGEAAAEVIADLRAEVALLRAEAAHLRAKVSLTRRGALPVANAAFEVPGLPIVRPSPALPLQLASSARVHEKGQQALRLELGGAMAVLSRLSRSSFAASQHEAQLKVGRDSGLPGDASVRSRVSCGLPAGRGGGGDVVLTGDRR